VSGRTVINPPAPGARRVNGPRSENQSSVIRHPSTCFVRSGTAISYRVADAETQRRRHGSTASKHGYYNLCRVPTSAAQPAMADRARGLTQQTQAVHMWTDVVSTVYVAELQRISLVLQITRGYAEQDGATKQCHLYFPAATAPSSLSYNY